MERRSVAIIDICLQPGGSVCVGTVHAGFARRKFKLIIRIVRQPVNLPSAWHAGTSSVPFAGDDFVKNSQLVRGLRLVRLEDNCCVARNTQRIKFPHVTRIYLSPYTHLNIYFNSRWLGQFLPTQQPRLSNPLPLTRRSLQAHKYPTSSSHGTGTVSISHIYQI